MGYGTKTDQDYRTSRQGSLIGRMGKLIRLARKGQAPGGGLYAFRQENRSRRQHTMADEMPKTKKPIYKRWWVWALGIIVLFIIIGAASGGGSDSSSNTKDSASGAASQSQAEPATAAIKVDAKKLNADYEANEVSADNQYKGEIIEVSGTIKDIGKDILDNPYVSFENGNNIFGVQCMFDKSDATALASLSKAQKITLTGKVSGKLGNVIINDCKIVQ